jgi:hypothetical protein
MPNGTSSMIFRLILAVAISLGLIFSPAGTSPSHDPAALSPAEATMHAELTTQIELHAHSHDDGEAHERMLEHSQGHNSADHSHAHNPADHSHGAANTVASLMHNAPRLGQSWRPYDPRCSDLGTRFSFERPPRSTLTV